MAIRYFDSGFHPSEVQFFDEGIAILIYHCKKIYGMVMINLAERVIFLLTHYLNSDIRSVNNLTSFVVRICSKLMKIQNYFSFYN